MRLIDPEDPTRGLKFDGRIGEDFKLANGTWVSVGPLRAELIGALAPVAQDVVIAGLDADFVTASRDPRRRCLRDDARTPARTPDVRGTRRRSPDWLHGSGSAWPRMRVPIRPAAAAFAGRALLPIAPSLDRGEITDKGSINQRAVLRHHADLVAELYSAAPPAHVAVIEMEKSRS